MESDVAIKEKEKGIFLINDIATQTSSIIKVEVDDETYDKSVTEKPENSGSGCVSIKTEPEEDDWSCQSSLYKDHYVKDELVIGPTVLQNQNGVLENPLETENASIESQCSETSLNDVTDDDSKKNRKKLHTCYVVGCQRAYIKKTHLIYHIRTHTGEKPYSCDYENCDRRFARADDLKRHKRVHTGQRPYVCNLCEKRFGRTDHLMKHMRTNKHYNYE